MHNVIRDMEIYTGDNEENCVLRAGQSLQHFPNIPTSGNCKQISVCGNDIKSLPAKDLRCPKLVSLFLSRNSYPKEILEAFLSQLHLVEGIESLASINKIIANILVEIDTT